MTDTTQAAGLTGQGKKILSLVDTLIASVNEAHKAHTEAWREGCFQAADKTYEEIRDALAAQPTQAAELTDEQIDKMLHDLDDRALAHGDDLPGLALNSRGLPGYRSIVRAALAAHAVPATRRLTEADRVPDEYRNQARGYRAGWNDALSPAPAEAKEEPKRWHTNFAPLGFTDSEKSAWSVGFEQGVEAEAAALATPQPQAAQPCEGANCGATDGKSHSAECIAETAKSQGWAEAREEPSRPTDDELWDQTLKERDDYHEWADQLAARIAAITGVDIGEHSSANCPWQNAVDAADEFDATPAPASEVV